MKKKLPKALIVFLTIIIVLIALILASVINYYYHVNWIIGKTSDQIEAQYGAFDWRENSPDENGIYKRTICSYEVIPKRVGFLGTYPPYLFSISFDSNGVAYKCFFETGGKGG